MLFKFIFFVFITAIPYTGIFAQTESAQELLQDAIRAMDGGETEYSRELLDKAEKLDPGKIIYPYERAFSFYKEKNYREAQKILKKIHKRPEASDIMYQLLGNTYDMIGNPKKAIKTYEKGLERFPNSGPLHLERGVMEIKAKNYHGALSIFKKGIGVAPNYSSCYYWASKIYLSSSKKVWGMIYAETFINLERNSQRTREISKLLFNGYKDNIKLKGDSLSVHFSDNTINLNIQGELDPKKLLKQLFETGTYEITMAKALIGEKAISLESLDRIRNRFIDFYFEDSTDGVLSIPIFDYRMKIKQNGFSKAYNYWLLSEGDTDEFHAWKQLNQKKWKAFVEWFTKNQLRAEKKKEEA
ncbi:tetratricopeptide repeat protein [Fulvitalea axinellae]